MTLKSETAKMTNRFGNLSFEIVNNLVFISEYSDGFNCHVVDFGCYKIENISFEKNDKRVSATLHIGKGGTYLFNADKPENASEFINALYRAMINYQKQTNLKISD